MIYECKTKAGNLFYTTSEYGAIHNTNIESYDARTIDEDTICQLLNRIEERLFILERKDKSICETVNKMMERELEPYDMGAYDVRYEPDSTGKIHTIVDVEFNDGVSGIDYDLFIAKAVNGKVSDKDYCDCTF